MFYEAGLIQQGTNRSVASGITILHQNNSASFFMPEEVFYMIEFDKFISYNIAYKKEGSEDKK